MEKTLAQAELIDDKLQCRVLWVVPYAPPMIETTQHRIISTIGLNELNHTLAKEAAK